MRALVDTAVDVGVAGGAAAGAAIGGALGSTLPVAGTLFGVIIGATAGYMIDRAAHAITDPITGRTKGPPKNESTLERGPSQLCSSGPSAPPTIGHPSPARGSG